MAWNIKSLNGYQTKAAPVGLGAPIAMNPSMTGRAYRDGWDIERAYREGVARVTWVFRCLDAIAGNQARLPVVLRKDNSPHGEIVTKAGRGSILDILNTHPNEGENAFVFRYRLSSQLLMSTRGVFIERVRSRDGKTVALHLLPPQSTAPIPDPKTFVSGFEVKLPNGDIKILPPNDVIWVRRPHPLDPYLSLTPMEAAGIAIEIDNLAKIYNRNYLLNDGRPGAILNVRGEIDEDDKDELRSRFRGNLNRTGQTTVISSEDGVDYIDTSANPRDAAYIQMREITKEEILAAFGVPESVIGNAAGRTFSNAAEEIRVFWMETMAPHLETLARALDGLDDKYYIDFDTSEVPILILSKQERQRYLMDEFQQGLISGNEYRVNAGLKRIDSELMDSMLANPNLTPIGNTEKKFDPNSQAPVDMPQNVPAGPPPGGMADQMLGGVAPTVQPEATPPAPAAEPTPAMPPSEQPPPAPMQQLSDANRMDYKDFAERDVQTKASLATERWVEILDRSLERFFERQQRVVLEKATGAKAKKLWAANNLSAEAIFDSKVWNAQLEEDIRPVLLGIVSEAVALAGGGADLLASEEVQTYLDNEMLVVKKTSSSLKDGIAAAILVTSALGSEQERSSMLRAAIAATYAPVLDNQKRVLAEKTAELVFNAGFIYGKAVHSAL